MNFTCSRKAALWAAAMVLAAAAVLLAPSALAAAPEIVSVSAAVYDNGGAFPDKNPSRNAGVYDVIYFSGAAGNYTATVTASAPLVSYDPDGAGTDQDEGKYFGVLIDLDIYNLAGAYFNTDGGDNFNQLGLQDITEANVAGAYNNNTLVWWLRVEDVRTGKTIYFKVFVTIICYAN